jgi:hypothetical protein
LKKPLDLPEMEEEEEEEQQPLAWVRVHQRNQRLKK